MSKGDLLDQIPIEKRLQLVGMLSAGAHGTIDDRELAEVITWAWADGYRSIVGLHDRALHILSYGRNK